MVINVFFTFSFYFAGVQLLLSHGTSRFRSTAANDDWNQERQP